MLPPTMTATLNAFHWNFSKLLLRHPLLLWHLHYETYQYHDDKQHGLGEELVTTMMSLILNIHHHFLTILLLKCANVMNNLTTEIIKGRNPTRKRLNMLNNFLVLPLYSVYIMTVFVPNINMKHLVALRHAPHSDTRLRMRAPAPCSGELL